MNPSASQSYVIPALAIRSLVFFAFLYLLIPNVLFLLGWVEPIVSLPLSVLLSFSLFRAWLKAPVPYIACTKKDIVKLIVAIGSVFLFMELISFHGHLPQHGDFFVRNPIYSTLVREPWPIFSERGEYFVYYLAFWLPSALVAKSTDILSPATLLYLWTFLGIVSALLSAFIRLKGKVLTFWIIFVAVGSIAHWATILPPCVVVWHTQNGSMQEFWSVLYAIQNWMTTIIYPCGVTQLTATFNHAVPFFLFFCLLFSKMIKWNYMALLSAIMVMYSPLAAAAILPLLAWLVIPHLLKRGGWVAQMRTCSLYVGILLVGIVVAYFTTSAISGSSSLTFFSRMGERGHGALYALSTYLFNVACILLPACLILKKRLLQTIYGRALLFLGISLPMIFIGSANNELLFKGSLIMYSVLALLYTYTWEHTGRTRICRVFMLVALLSSGSFFINLGYAVPNISFSREGISRNIHDEWKGHLNHPEAWNYRDFWAENKPRSIFIIPSDVHRAPADAE